VRVFDGGTRCPDGKRLAVVKDMSNEPRLLLAEHHDELERLCREIEVGIHADDPRDLVQRYRAFEKAVTDHLAAEEEEILAAYGDYDQRDAFSIRGEHAALRGQLAETGVEVELHAVRAATLRKLLDALRAHSLHEERGMYPWAQAYLPLSSRKRLFLTIANSLDTLARIRRAFANAQARTLTS
jgi:hypothetical protein